MLARRDLLQTAWTLSCFRSALRAEVALCPRASAPPYVTGREVGLDAHTTNATGLSCKQQNDHKEMIPKNHRNEFPCIAGFFPDVGGVLTEAFPRMRYHGNQSQNGHDTPISRITGKGLGSQGSAAKDGVPPGGVVDTSLQPCFSLSLSLSRALSRAVSKNPPLTPPARVGSVWHGSSLFACLWLQLWFRSAQTRLDRPQRDCSMQHAARRHFAMPCKPMMGSMTVRAKSSAADMSNILLAAHHAVHVCGKYTDIMQHSNDWHGSGVRQELS